MFFFPQAFPLIFFFLHAFLPLFLLSRNLFHGFTCLAFCQISGKLTPCLGEQNIFDSILLIFPVLHRFSKTCALLMLFPESSLSLSLSVFSPVLRNPLDIYFCMCKWHVLCVKEISVAQSRMIPLPYFPCSEAILFSCWNGTPPSF